MTSAHGSEQNNLKLILVQAISLGRAACGFVFASTALLPGFSTAAIIIYTCGTLSDFLDGLLARKMQCATKMGAALDVFGDKFLTIASLMYAIARGLWIIPCLMFAVREILILSLRSVHLGDRPVVPLTGVVGGITLIPIRTITLLLLLNPTLESKYVLAANLALAAGSSLSMGSLTYSIIKNWHRLMQAFKIRGL